MRVQLTSLITHPWPSPWWPNVYSTASFHFCLSCAVPIHESVLIVIYVYQIFLNIFQTSFFPEHFYQFNFFGSVSVLILARCSASYTVAGLFTGGLANRKLRFKGSIFFSYFWHHKQLYLHVSIFLIIYKILSYLSNFSFNT